MTQCDWPMYPSCDKPAKWAVWDKVLTQIAVNLCDEHTAELAKECIQNGIIDDVLGKRIEDK